MILSNDCYNRGLTSEDNIEDESECTEDKPGLAHGNSNEVFDLSDRLPCVTLTPSFRFSVIFISRTQHFHQSRLKTNQNMLNPSSEEPPIAIVNFGILVQSETPGCKRNLIPNRKAERLGILALRPPVILAKKPCMCAAVYLLCESHYLCYVSAVAAAMTASTVAMVLLTCLLLSHRRRSHVALLIVHPYNTASPCKNRRIGNHLGLPQTTVPARVDVEVS